MHCFGVAVTHQVQLYLWTSGSHIFQQGGSVLCKLGGINSTLLLVFIIASLSNECGWMVISDRE